MEYLADTVAIIRHFSGTGRIGRAARLVLEGVEKGENNLFLSSVSLVEILYLAEKKRIGIKQLLYCRSHFKHRKSGLRYPLF